MSQTWGLKVASSDILRREVWGAPLQQEQAPLLLALALSSHPLIHLLSESVLGAETLSSH